MSEQGGEEWACSIPHGLKPDWISSTNHCNNDYFMIAYHHYLQLGYASLKNV